MGNVKDRSETFYKNCGEILRLALSVESMLDYFISNYFCPPQSQKTFLFSDLILIDLNFGRKIGIFNEICEHEKIDKKRLMKITKAINHINDARNMVAHYEAYQSSAKQIVLRTRKSMKYIRGDLTITDKLVKEIDQKRLFCIKELVQIQKELSEPSRPKILENF